MEHETRAIEKRDARRRQLEGSNQTVPLWKLFTFADRLDIVLIAVGTIGAVVAGAPLPIFSYIFGEILDGLGEGGRSTTEQGSHALVQKVSQASLRAFLVGVGSGVGFFFELVCWTIIGERQASRIKTMYLKSLLRQDVSFFDKEISTGEVLDKMSGDTLYIQQATGDKAGKIIQLLSTVACGFLIAFIKGWKLTLVTLATIPLIIGSGVAMALAVSKAASRAQAATAEAGTIVEQVISAIRTVAAFTGERRAIKEYNQALEKANKANKQQALVSGLGQGTILFFTFCSYALTFSFGSWLIIHDRYSGGTVMTVLFAIIIGSGALGQSLPCWGVFTHGRVAAYKMFRIIQRVPIIDVYDTKGLVLNHVEGEIELQNVFFAYPARPEFQVFSGFSLKVPKGTTAAIVGESGSGKSTIISLIERFYDPQDGKVLVDGIDIKNLQLSWLREQIGLVTQETVLIGTSIRENILYGKEEATFEEIETAAELANAAKFIKELPEGYDTLVGGLGMQLSGGQKQRLAIARAILKNPCILLLDEATSALDTESERIVHKALQQVMINRTTVMVTHRLHTIKYADYIAVLQHGSIVEIGSHKELSADPDSIYSRLIKLHDTTQICDENREQLHDNKFSRSATSRQLYSFGNVDHVMSEDIYHNSSDFLDRIDLQVWGKTGNTGDLEMGSTRGANKDVHLWRLASLNKSEVPVILLGSIAAAINGIIMPLTGFLLANMIHTFYDPPHKLQEDCRFWVAMFLAIAFASLVVSPTQNFCMNVAGIRLIHRLRLMTFERVIGQDISWFDRKGNSSGIVSARLSGDAAELRNMVGDALALVAQNMATVTASLVISFSASWQLTLVLLALLPLLSLEGWTQLKLTDACSTQAKAINEKTNNIIHEAVSSIRIVASLCAESRILELYKQKNQASLKSGIRRGFIGGIGLGLSNTLMCASFACSFWVGVHLIANGKITGNQFLKVFFVIQLSAVAVSQSTALAPDISKMKAAVSSVFALIDQKSKIDPFDSSGTRIEQVKGAIEIRHLIFWYPMRPNVPIFHNLSLTIDSGKIVALVGESGGGKSSLISLLQRFYDPQSGEILLDNVNIKKLQLKWLRQQMGLVNQEPFLFDDTIRANIQYGKDDVISDEDMEKAATIANAHNFISELPEGYNTRVGERGIQLSGGQKQRIAIARALIRNPRILLLDEATSALDVECERVVQEALDRFMAGRTTIVIAHRLSTIRNSHVIVVMKDGAILEQGSHEKLIAQQNGHYASLVGNYTGG